MCFIFAICIDSFCFVQQPFGNALPSPAQSCLSLQWAWLMQPNCFNFLADATTSAPTMDQCSTWINLP